MNKIIININEANKAQKYQTKEELFQFEAFERVSEILKEHKIENHTKDITDCRFHDTIFIDGDRGVGKTAFMINIENYYKNIEKTEKSNYIFLKSVDPTLLEHTEKFLGVILARIVEKVTDLVTDRDIDPKYYECLEKVSKSLSSISSLSKNEDVGIEEIASNKSSLKLEQYTHEFFKIVSNIFGVNGIVMLIDDVDMAFDKGFDVLEVVRKYLASPFLIPIVAGDMRLYREIVETRFKEKIQFFNDVKYLKDLNENLLKSDEYKEKVKLLNNLVEQYLHKVFPGEYYIKLDSIFKILKNNYVNIKFNNDLIIPYTEVKDFEIRHINLGINQVDFTYQIFSDNTRDFIQYIYSKKNIYELFFKNINYPKESQYQKYIPQNVIKKYDKEIMNFIFCGNIKLYKDSLYKTSTIYFNSKNKQKELSKLTLNDVNSYINEKYNLFNAFKSNFFKNLKIENEKINNNYVIEYKSYKKENSAANNVEKYIMDLFIFNDYYTQHQTRNYIFSGKFLEMIIFSLSIDVNVTLDSKYLESIEEKINIDFLLKDGDSEIYNYLYSGDVYNSVKELNNTVKIVEKLNSINHTIPFNSEFIKNKRFNDDFDEWEEEELKFNYEINNLGVILSIWKSVFCREVKLNSISLYEIIHKFYNNYNLLKSLDRSDKPLIFMQRTVLILINTIAYFENTSTSIANTNIATVKEFNLENVLTKTNASTFNIKPMLSERNSLTRAMFYHPLIQHILFPNDDSILNDLEFVKQKNKDETLKKTNKNIDILQYLNGYGYKSGLAAKNRILVMNKILADSKTFSKEFIEKLKNSHDYKRLIGLTSDNEEYNKLVLEFNKIVNA